MYELIFEELRYDF
jgi:hypothetical protein